ncbi:Tn7 transposon transposition protein TnsD [Syntrophotalea carbinolica DSM 2380]|uniref:Tn7 transposon transposition protein TnsD n=1 Tax=Syntrophotalea carbinolica (strain DSM 2380 / NBRC 103641 / GraBd1) TaxID=338963 RepID=Q3A0F0_SYNC1|nr:TnsD family Tn7-like transposition protein [Syntrophotalea carbinolica]ABA90157.1 Tn7 transposon transposition protein TnsD [Syntrophotalea carbinolica DSM 2380]
MIVQFPVAHPDELLGSIISRFVQRQGIRNDKVALKLLFDSRQVVPSALFQGHIDQLLAQVGHVWRIEAHKLIESHTILPLFRPFIPHARYGQLLRDLRRAGTNPSMLRSGINSSSQIWPSRFKICPICWQSQQREFGYAFWQRLFQCPGVECCPIHHCLLIGAGLEMQSPHRHHFVGTQEIEAQGFIDSGAADAKEIKLATLVQELLGPVPEVPDMGQWSSYYQKVASDTGNLKRNRANHVAISGIVTTYWGGEWLKINGLCLESADNWLVRIFRRHRKPFTYLQHMVCWLALNPDTRSVKDVLEDVSKCPQYPTEKKQYFSPKAKQNRCKYRESWRSLVKRNSSLKNIRSDREGERLYSWLYRYDHDWLQRHKPQRLERNRRPRVNWHARDLKILRQLLAVEKKNGLNLSGPRRSKAWYCRQVENRCLLEKKLDLLPLCAAFFVRHAESVEKYQARRLFAILSELIQRQEQGIAVHEIQRMAGLSKESYREAARRILQQNIPAWQKSQSFSEGR